MKKILVYQHLCSSNHGCEALAYTVSKQIKTVLPSCEVVLSSFNKEDDEMFSFPNVDRIIQNTQWLRRFTFPWLMYEIDSRLLKNKAVQERFMYCKPCYNEAKDADVLIAIGGDNYCYNKGKEHWPLERKMKKLGKKMMLWGCSIEPEDVEGEMAEHLSNFDVITARDPISYEALINGGVKSKIYRCADPAFLLEKSECELPTEWEQGKMIGLNFSPMVIGEIEKKEETRTAISNLIEHILNTSDNKIVLIPHVRLSYNDDVDELLPFYEKYKDTKRIILIDDKLLSARNLKYIISKCEFFVGARTHATIAAYSTGVPTLSIGYSVKARGIARDLFGTEENMTVSVGDLAGTNKLIEAYEKLYENKEEISERLKNIMPEYSKQALVSGEALKELVNG